MFPEIVETTHYSRIYGIYWVVYYSPHRTVRCLAENIGNPPLQNSFTDRTDVTPLVYVDVLCPRN